MSWLSSTSEKKTKLNIVNIKIKTSFPELDEKEYTKHCPKVITPDFQ